MILATPPTNDNNNGNDDDDINNNNNNININTTNYGTGLLHAQGYFDDNDRSTDEGIHRILFLIRLIRGYLLQH